MVNRTRKKPKSAGAPAAERFVIREVQPQDLGDLYKLSKHLDSVNFPADKQALSQIIKRCRASFRGEAEIFRREYMFVMEACHSHKLCGVSMIFAQHGHNDAPHIYFDVVTDERYSLSLKRHFRHLTLRLGFNFDGPTEIGSLVLSPAFRAKGLGKPLSFVRFLFIGMFRERFRDHVIAELLPPLLPDGRSELWEHLGRRFTGLDYREADHLSHDNKEFITALFPQIPLYASLIPPQVQALIGRVGAETLPVAKMLESIGFSYSNRIDPFDGGPHYEVHTDRISLLGKRLQLPLSAQIIDETEEVTGLRTPQAPGELQRALIATANRRGPTDFRATEAAVRIQQNRVELSTTARNILRLKTGQEVSLIPL